MNKQLSKLGIIRLWQIQGFLLLALILIVAVFSHCFAVLSALLGGVLCMIPNIFFAKRLFKHQGAGSAKKIVNNFYTGEALKIILSILLFALVFASVKITPWAFFAAYIMIQLTHWFTPLIVINKQNRP